MAAHRQPLISGNWKMNHNHFEAIQTVQKLGYLLKETLREPASVEVSVHPPFTDIRSVQTTVESDKLPLGLGAQNCHAEPNGAFTGEVSAPMLAKLNVAYVIVGHSERRQLFGETDAIVNAKVKAVLANEMVPILCVGETLEERQAGQTDERVAGQVVASLNGIDAAQVAGMVIAYEPIWAIGTGQTASSEQAQEVCSLVRTTVAANFGSEAAESVRVQYGGSVKADNIAELMAQPDIDGALVGGASLDPDVFAAVVSGAVAP
jgi:triosephosphate isomerase (TIM)